MSNAPPPFHTEDPDGVEVAVCPLCQARIRLVAVPDLREVSGREYIEHWLNKHSEPHSPGNDRG